VSPLRGEKPQNRPLSKRNTGRFALRAMLPVNIHEPTVLANQRLTHNDVTLCVKLTRADFSHGLETKTIVKVI